MTNANFAPRVSAPSTSPSLERPSFEELLGVLQYNQGLVEFADSKAGSLILLNSLLIAAVAALPNGGDLGLFKLGSLLISSAAVFVCFQVIRSAALPADDAPAGLMARQRSRTTWEADDFLFFDRVTSHKNGEEYCRAYGQSHPDARRRSLLQRTYVIAGIAKRKFAQYATAQKLTTVAMAVWVTVNVLPFISLNL